MNKAQKAQERKQKFDDLNITEEEEIKIGADVSLKIRQRFGVVQDAAVHKYVSLVGTVLARADDAAEAAVDVHRARHRRRQRVCGARRLRAHHPRRARADQERSGARRRARPRDRARRAEAHGERHPKEQGRAARHQRDARRTAARSWTRWPTGPTAWCWRTRSIAATSSTPTERASCSRRRSGYAGTRAGGVSRRASPTATRTRPRRTACSPRIPRPRSASARSSSSRARSPARWCAARYTSTIKYQPTEITKIATVVEGSAGLAGSEQQKAEDKKAEDKKPEEKKKGFGLGESHANRSSTGKNEQQVSASGGARGVGADRLAKGGDNPNPVKGAFSPAELAAFKKGIA